MSAFFTMMGDFFGGRVPLPPPPVAIQSPESASSNSAKKRSREGQGKISGSRTPTLVFSRQDDERPWKKLRGDHNAIPVPLPDIVVVTHESQLQSSLLRMIPDEVVGHCLSFLGSTEHRFALQTTCQQFHRISNSDAMLVGVTLGGDTETERNGIIQEHDTAATAAAALTPFARAGNLEAVYMLGMIKSYCHQDVERGIFLLKLAAKRGYVRSSYTLGLILRDSMPDEASRHMSIAAEKGYLPALQEILPAREMKAKYGEPKAMELKKFLDPSCLNRLLGRHYLHCSLLREVNTSHCWNPFCGRWAFKAQVSANGTPLRLRRPFNFAYFRNDQGILVAHNDSTVCLIGGHSIGMKNSPMTNPMDLRVSRMKMCSRCCRAKYCSKLCQVYDWRSGRHKMECQFL